MPPPSPRSDEKAPAEHVVGTPDGVSGLSLEEGPPSPVPAEGMPVVAAGQPQWRDAVPAPPPMPLSRFNAAPAEAASAMLLRCCGSSRWAARIAACRPYPEAGSLLAAVDEASYDMTSADLAEALASEAPQLPLSDDGVTRSASGRVPRGHDRPGLLAAHTALRAAHAAYENRFGYAFLVCLDGWGPDEWLDQALAAVRTRLGHDPEEERPVVAEELRRLARARIRRLVRVLPEAR